MLLIPRQSMRLVSPRLRPVLCQLADAYSCAAELKGSAWQFSLRLHTLLNLGATETDLRWMIQKGYLEHAKETTGEKSVARSFRKVSHLSFSENSCLILTEGGFRLTVVLTTEPVAGACEETDPSLPEGLAKWQPLWLPERRELYLGEHLVKKYQVPAQNQITILEAFQEEHWPRRIDNPLPPTADTDALTRLHDAVTRLNRRQQYHLLRFHSDGTGEGVSWEIAR